MRWRQSFATVIVGKSILLREGIARILRSADFRIFASALSVDELLFNKVQSHQQLFLIVHSGDDFDVVIEQIELFRSRHPNARIGIVADRYRLDELTSSFRAGANGYFVDVTTCDVFVKSIELLMMGETFFPLAFAASAFGPEGHRADEARQDDSDSSVMEHTIAPQLSPRERSIVQGLIEGASNKSIARKLDIAEATVKVHVKAVLRKIGAQNRTQAAIWGMNNRVSVHLSTGQRLPKPTTELHDIPQIETTNAPPGVINHYENQVALADHLTCKSAQRPMIRLRK